MFRPEGKFSAVLCPLGAGVECSRPYCYFRHAKESRENSKIEDVATPSCSLTDVSLIDVSPKRDDGPDVGTPAASRRRSHIPAINILQYKPTPLATLQKRREAYSRSLSSGEKDRSQSQLSPSVTSREVIQISDSAEFEDDEDEEAILKEIFQKDHATDPNTDIRHGVVKGSSDKKDSKENEIKKDEKVYSGKRKHGESRSGSDSSRSSSSGNHKSSSSSSSRKKHRKSSSSSRESSRDRDRRSDSHKRTSSHRSESRKSGDKDMSRSKESIDITRKSTDQKEKIKEEIRIDLSDSDSMDTRDMGFLTSDNEMEEDDLEQCREIFNESQVPTTKEEKMVKEEVIKVPSNIVEMVGTTKKRVAHDPFLKPQPVIKKHVALSPSQQLALRLESVAKAQEAAAQSKPAPPTVIDKKRIAHVSTNLIKAVAAKNNLPMKTAPVINPYKKLLEPPKPHATNHVQPKGVSRLSHKPKLPAAPAKESAPPRPRITYDAKIRIPLNIRQIYLDKLIDAHNLIENTYEESYEKSVEEERSLCQRSKDKRVYMSLLANLLVKLKKQSGEIQKTKQPSNTMSHADILGGAKAKKLSFSIEKRNAQRQASVENFTENQLYEHLRENYLMTPEQLGMMGYPRPHGQEAGYAIFCDERSKDAKRIGGDHKTRKICCRCKKEYELNDDGSYVKIETCSYHWGKNWTRKVKKGNTREQQYTCCDAESGSDGCCVAQGHVSDNPLVTEDSGYCTTFMLNANNPNKKVYALDCEMIYTTKGTELARVSVVDMNLKSIYETTVRPQYPVLDYNTRFSGLKAEDFIDCKTSIYDVQAVLLSLFPADCILVGHSLESDLKALKLIHSTVVDTSVMFPHKMGLPYKRALKNLLKEYCQKIIQDGVDGHDSAEDARACMELLLVKVKQDLKSR